MLLSYRHKFIVIHVWKVAGMSIHRALAKYADMPNADGRLLVDFVGRYERLHEDFQYVCRTLGVEATLPHVNPSRHGDYRSYYNIRTMNMLKDVAREDIEMFAYEFDDPISAPRRGAA